MLSMTNEYSQYITSRGGVEGHALPQIRRLKTLGCGGKVQITRFDTAIAGTQARPATRCDKGGAMKEYNVSTGPKYSMTVYAADAREAIIKAFKKKAPKTVGLLVIAKTHGEPEVFMNPVIALQEAGYVVSEEER